MKKFLCLCLAGTILATGLVGYYADAASVDWKYTPNAGQRGTVRSDTTVQNNPSQSQKLSTVRDTTFLEQITSWSGNNAHLTTVNGKTYYLKTGDSYNLSGAQLGQNTTLSGNYTVTDYSNGVLTLKSDTTGATHIIWANGETTSQYKGFKTFENSTGTYKVEGGTTYKYDGGTWKSQTVTTKTYNGQTLTSLEGSSTMYTNPAGDTYYFSTEGDFVGIRYANGSVDNVTHFPNTYENLGNGRWKASDGNIVDQQGKVLEAGKTQSQGGSNGGAGSGTGNGSVNNFDRASITGDQSGNVLPNGNIEYETGDTITTVNSRGEVVSTRRNTSSGGGAGGSSNAKVGDYGDFDRSTISDYNGTDVGNGDIVYKTDDGLFTRVNSEGKIVGKYDSLDAARNNTGNKAGGGNGGDYDHEIYSSDHNVPQKEEQFTIRDVPTDPNIVTESSTIQQDTGSITRTVAPDGTETFSGDGIYEGKSSDQLRSEWDALGGDKAATTTKSIDYQSYTTDGGPGAGKDITLTMPDGETQIKMKYDAATDTYQRDGQGTRYKMGDGQLTEMTGPITKTNGNMTGTYNPDGSTTYTVEYENGNALTKTVDPNGVETYRGEGEYAGKSQDELKDIWNKDCADDQKTLDAQQPDNDRSSDAKKAGSKGEDKASEAVPMQTAMEFNAIQYVVLTLQALEGTKQEDATKQVTVHGAQKLQDSQGAPVSSYIPGPTDTTLDGSNLSCGSYSLAYLLESNPVDVSLLETEGLNPEVAADKVKIQDRYNQLLQQYAVSAEIIAEGSNAISEQFYDRVKELADAIPEMSGTLGSMSILNDSERYPYYEMVRQVTLSGVQLGLKGIKTLTDIGVGRYEGEDDGTDDGGTNDGGAGDGGTGDGGTGDGGTGGTGDNDTGDVEPPTIIDRHHGSGVEDDLDSVAKSIIMRR